ncbi:MAG: TetR/AcrR family transcriptional regulator [Vicinamibacteria bacterium]
MKQHDTRARLIESATDIFVNKGFNGARVEEIARRARANKAMIYYHFGSKEKLYRAVLLKHIGGLHEEMARVAEEAADPLDRLVAFYGALGRIFKARPALPVMMFREILSGGVHMDEGLAHALKGVLDFVRGTIAEGIATGRLREVDPIAVHFSMIAPMMLFCVSRPFRERLLPIAVPEDAPPTAEGLFAHLQEVLVRTLERGTRSFQEQEMK